MYKGIRKRKRENLLDIKLAQIHSMWKIWPHVVNQSYFSMSTINHLLYFVVGSQTASLTCGLSFFLNLCFKCPNESCKPILDIYISIAFKWYKELPNARCFDPYNCSWSFGSPGGLPSSHFGSVSLHPHTFSNLRLRHFPPLEEKVNVFIDI
jgi:hypothetical protein